jgi:ribosomal protein L11 methyltransferase
MMNAAKWIEVSLTVDGELAEAVAEVFSRFAPQGVVIESTAIAPDPLGEGAPIGPVRVCAYLPFDHEIEQRRLRLEEALWYLGRISPLPEAQFSPVEEVDWVSSWKQHYQPIPIGEQLIILPDWIEDYPAQRIPIRIDPGMAFGTGTHPSTQLCLQMAEELMIVRNPAAKPISIIDIGCGSGILSIGAIKLGAQYALGVDIDPQAIKNAQRNVAVNDVADRVELGVGSVSDILADRFSIRQASLIFTNILANVITQLFEDGLAELLAPGGALILSGILVEQSQEIENRAQNHGLVITKRYQMGDWVALLAEKTD